MKADLTRLRRAFAAPPADIRLYLLHGPDESGAAIAAGQLVTAFGSVERIDLDGAALRKTPGRLAEEAASLSLFGDARLIRVTAVGDESLEAITLLLDGERSDGHPVVALAPGLRSTAKVVKLATASPHALVTAFYEPTAEEIERQIATLAREQGLTVEAGVARRLVDAAGGDRLVIAREIDKLAVFLDAAPDRPRPLDHDALDRVGADLADTATDAVTAAVVDGDPIALGQVLERLASGGVAAIPWLRAIERRLVALAAMRVDLDGGDGIGDVMKRHRVFFREEAATAAALRRWSPLMLTRALARLYAAERAMMAAGNAGGVIADAAALDLARGIATRR